MTEPGGRRMTFCGNDEDGTLDQKFVKAHSGSPGGLSDFDLDRLNRKWRRLRRLAQANRLGGVQEQG